MSEKAEWVIESFVGNVGWSVSRLNDSTHTHTLDWCMEVWNEFKRDNYKFGLLLTEPHRYRLRNVITEDIILCAIL